MAKNFNELGLSEATLEAVRKKGFEEPTAIQELVISGILRGDSNIIAQAQTGTGKTAAFGLPLIEMIDLSKKTVQALILTPTRELAIQVSEEISSLKGKKNIRTAPIYGGQSISQQLRRLKKGIHIVVGTPGRVIDHLKRKTLKLQEIEYLILDEADEMLNMGFIDDIEEIMKYTNPAKRTLLFSATMPKKIKDLAYKYMKGYEFIKVKAEQLTPNLTEQIYFEVKAVDKFEALCRIIDIEEDFYALVFCRTKNDVDLVSHHLLDRGYDAGAIHGDISQVQREKILNRFRKKQIRVLIATDVAARGIDINNLTHVINYSLPQDPESYVHRIGRTGRAGNEGTAVTFITPSEYKKLLFIKRIAKTDIKKSKVPQIKDIIDVKKKKIFDELNEIFGEEVDAVYYNLAENFLKGKDPLKVIASVLSYSFKSELNPENYRQIQEIKSKGLQIDQHGKARLFVALGKKDKMDAKKLVELIASKTAVKTKQISDVQVMDKFSFLTVPFKEAENIVAGFKRKGKKPLVSHAKKTK